MREPTITRLAIKEKKLSAFESVMEHIRYLSVEIGPRGSTTPEEALASDYAESVYRKLGLNPVRQPITSARSAWRGFGMGAVIFLLAEIPLLVGGRVGARVAAVMAGIALVSVLLELYFERNPLRWLQRRGHSQNIYAVIPPRSEVRRKLVIVGHVDTHRTPLVLRSAQWLFAYRTITLAGIAALIVNMGLFLYITLGGPLAARLFTLPASGAIAIVMVLTLQADFTQFSVGANDNATGAGMVLGLAERLIETPLEHTEVWALSSGCEEVGCYGAGAFIKANREELGNAYFLAIDSVGGREAELNYFTRQALIFPFDSDPHLVALAEEVSGANPELGAKGIRMVGARTEGAMATKHGLRSLSIVHLDASGAPTDWHQTTDVFENVNPDLVARTETFLWELMQSLDRNPGG